MKSEVGVYVDPPLKIMNDYNCLIEVLVNKKINSKITTLKFLVFSHQKRCCFLEVT